MVRVCGERGVSHSAQDSCVARPAREQRPSWMSLEVWLKFTRGSETTARSAWFQGAAERLPDNYRDLS
jgi:hypothetical protein